jgi:transposase
LAFKKGRTYGTIVVDLSSNQVVDLLPDREAATVSDWIKRHPEIQLISRDRYGPYAVGASKGAIQAIQVADRFHLMRNLGDATSRMFQTKSKVLKEVYDLYNDVHPPKESVLQTKVNEAIFEDQTAKINPSKMYNFRKVKELQQQGFSKRAIAISLKISRKTVGGYFCSDELYIRKGHSVTNFDSFASFLMQEHNRNKTSKELYQSIKENGYSGKYSNFCDRINNLYASNRIIKAGIGPKIVQRQTWSPNKLSFLLYTDKEKLSIENKSIYESTI